jgi:hypothetical protein
MEGPRSPDTAVSVVDRARSYLASLSPGRVVKSPLPISACSPASPIVDEAREYLSTRSRARLKPPPCSVDSVADTRTALIDSVPQTGEMDASPCQSELIIDSPYHRDAPASGSPRISLAAHFFFFWKAQWRCTRVAAAWLQLVPDMVPSLITNLYFRSATSPWELLGHRVHALRYAVGLCHGVLFWWAEWRSYVLQFRSKEPSCGLRWDMRCSRCYTLMPCKKARRFWALACYCLWHPLALSDDSRDSCPCTFCQRCGCNRLFYNCC